LLASLVNLLTYLFRYRTHVAWYSTVTYDGLVSIVWCKTWFQRRRSNSGGNLYVLKDYK